MNVQTVDKDEGVSLEQAYIVITIVAEVNVVNVK